MTGTPFRIVVLTKITEGLKAITPANGYEHDLSAAVFRGRAVYGTNDPLPMLSIIEDPRERRNDQASVGSTASNGEWKLVIQGFVVDDFENPTDPAYLLEAEVRKALSDISDERNNLLGLGSKKPCVNALEIGDPIVRPADEFSEKAYFWIPLTVRLTEDLKNPFT